MMALLQKDNVPPVHLHEIKECVPSLLHLGLVSIDAVHIEGEKTQVLQRPLMVIYNLHLLRGYASVSGG